MELNYIQFNDLENYILTEGRKKFFKNGFLDSFDFFCIIIWKANRAKSTIAKRLLKNNLNLDQSVRVLTNKIFLAENNKEKLRILINDYGFRLPMASAILSLLYPEIFTIYDTRVCDTFPNFKGIDNLNFERIWDEYCKYIEAVKGYSSVSLSLRDKDKLLWGKSFYEQLKRDIKNEFKK